MEKFKIKILIVDDVEANLLAFKAILSKLDLELFEANSGSVALKILMREEIDIVLLDVQMPDINGFEVAQLMRENVRTMSIPIIFITAINKEEKYIFKGYELGAVDYLYKPISNDLLTSKIKVFVQLQQQKKIIEAKSNELKIKVEALEKAEKELNRLTRTDQLTGVINRRGFDENLDLIWRRAIRMKLPITLLMIDIDNFKNYNDVHGHPEGDTCLKKVACAIDDTLSRPYDQVSRYGGEEFVVILPESELDGGIKIAENIRRNVEKMKLENNINGKENYVTVSIGIATLIPVIGDDKLEFINHSDEALYKAKETGRNKYCIYGEQEKT